MDRSRRSREPFALLDRVGVVIRAQLGFAWVPGVGGQEPDHVGHEDVRRDLPLRVLVQEVIDLPALVAHPQVVAGVPDNVVEQQVVRAEDLVHAPEGVEGGQVVVRGF